MKGKKPFSVRLKSLKKFQRLIAGIPQSEGVKAGHVVLQPHESVGEHLTLGKEEVLILLKGKAKVTCGKRKALICESNSLVYIPAQALHDVQNIGKGELEYVYVTSPV